MKARRVTIKDIAKELGVHNTTVSLALRDSSLLKNETKERIKEKAGQMGYLPNKLAQGFRKGSSNSIGILVPSIYHHFFSHFISEVTEHAYNSGISVIVMQSNEKLETEKMNIESLITNQVAGVIASISHETRNGKHFKLLRQYGIPYLFFDRVPDDFQGPSVVVDNYQLSYDAVEMMIRKGKKRIAIITRSIPNNVFTERLRGYNEAIKKNRLSFSKTLVLDEGHAIESGTEAAAKLMSYGERPDGILTVNDRVALGVMRYLNNSGYRIPEDVSVIGFDNDPIGMAVKPELTTCNQPTAELAGMAFKVLLDLIEKKKTINQKIEIKGTLLVRESC